MTISKRRSTRNFVFFRPIKFRDYLFLTVYLLVRIIITLYNHLHRVVVKSGPVQFQNYTLKSRPGRKNVSDFSKIITKMCDNAFERQPPLYKTKSI